MGKSIEGGSGKTAIGDRQDLADVIYVRSGHAAREIGPREMADAAADA